MSLLLLWTLMAQASPLYPPALAEALQLDCAPPCTLCHQSLAGGEGTVVQPFGVALMERGLAPGGDVDALFAVLEEAEAEGQDVAGDGVPDIERLEDGMDPNPGGLAFCALEGPIYGCFSHTSAAPTATLGALALLLAAWRSRRRLPDLQADPAEDPPLP